MIALIIITVLVAFFIGGYFLNKEKDNDNTGGGGYVDTDTKGNQEV